MLFLMIFAPLPLSQTVTNLEPPLKVCHTSEQKVNKQISGKCRLPLNDFNHYYILNNNKRPYWVFLTNSESLISYNSESDSCSLNLYYVWWNIKFKILNYELWKKWKCDVTQSSPPPLSQTVTLSQTPPPLERDILYGRPLTYYNWKQWN